MSRGWNYYSPVAALILSGVCGTGWSSPHRGRPDVATAGTCHIQTLLGGSDWPWSPASHGTIEPHRLASPVFFRVAPATSYIIRIARRVSGLRDYAACPYDGVH